MTTPSNIIQKKRDGIELSTDEIHTLIRGIVQEQIPDYQATAFLMAVFFRGMTLNETVALTQAMLESGERYDLSDIPGPKLDKHSTGGVGDKVSLILAPLASACGLKIPMMSGRGLGHSGGTLDKLESIPGYQVNLTRERFTEILRQTGCAIIGQSEKMVPADKKLYALRDVTATVECIPLIVASILSKKLAEGTNALVLDVKVGSGAFMKDMKSAKKLAKTIMQVSSKLGLPCQAVLTNMHQPLGYAVGNTLEVIESIEVLQNKSKKLNSSDLKELTIHLCSQMLQLGGMVRTLAEGRKLAYQKLNNKEAWKVFQNMVQAQGGDLSTIQHQATQDVQILNWESTKRGYITRMDTAGIGKILVEMDGGRKKTSDTIHPNVGFLFHKKLGAHLRVGEIIAVAYAPSRATQKDLDIWYHAFLDTIEIQKTRKPVLKLLLDAFTK